MLVLKEDSHGLFYEAKVGTHALGQDFIKQVESGVITEHSIGFRTIKRDKRDGHNHLREVQLYEGSALTCHGANEKTPLLSLKSHEIVARAADRLDSIRKSYRAGDYAEDTLDLIDLEIKQLQQFFVAHTVAAEAPQPEVDEAVLRELKQLRQILKATKC